MWKKRVIVYNLDRHEHFGQSAELPKGFVRLMQRIMVPAEENGRSHPQRESLTTEHMADRTPTSEHSTLVIVLLNGLFVVIVSDEVFVPEPEPEQEQEQEGGSTDASSDSSKKRKRKKKPKEKFVAQPTEEDVAEKEGVKSKRGNPRIRL